ncbi:hypothetical protein BDV3_005376 [Batrachochytrium dendrobatidis]|nr:hypothetical protein BDEG_23415 [Batrachochytrium dendrobatidis JEL423]
MAAFATFAIGFQNSLVVAQCSRTTVRKELYDMNERDWTIYTETIRKATMMPDPNGSGYSIWEAGAQLHNRVASMIHGNCQFLFWHRMFMSWTERRLQAINPEFSFFYWDSASEWSAPTNSIIWKYLGRSGRPVRDGFLSDVSFRSTNGPLIRNFQFPNLGGILPSTDTYSQMYTDSIANGGFAFYAPRLELYHGQVHVLIGGGPMEDGQMQSMLSPLDPFFFAHHGHIDWMWFNAQAGWANYRPDSAYQIGGLDHMNMTCSLNSPLSGFQGVLADVLDLRSLCVQYSNPRAGGNRPPPQPGFSQPLPNDPMQSGGGFNTGFSAPPGGFNTGLSVPPGGNMGSGAFQQFVQPFQPPAGYTPMNQCPQNLPAQWLSMNFRNPNAITLCESIRVRCEELRIQIASGRQVNPFQVLIDAPGRPLISQVVPFSASGAQPMNVPLVPTIDQSYYPHGGSIITSKATSRLGEYGIDHIILIFSSILAVTGFITL